MSPTVIAGLPEVVGPCSTSSLKLHVCMPHGIISGACSVAVMYHPEDSWSVRRLIYPPLDIWPPQERQACEGGLIRGGPHMMCVMSDGSRARPPTKSDKASSAELCLQHHSPSALHRARAGRAKREGVGVKKDGEPIFPIAIAAPIRSFIFRCIMAIASRSFGITARSGLLRSLPPRTQIRVCAMATVKQVISTDKSPAALGPYSQVGLGHC